MTSYSLLAGEHAPNHIMKVWITWDEKNVLKLWTNRGAKASWQFTVHGYADDEMYTKMEELSKVYRLTVPSNDYNRLTIHKNDKISHEAPQKGESWASLHMRPYPLKRKWRRKLEATKRNENGRVINNQLYEYKNKSQSVCLWILGGDPQSGYFWVGPENLLAAGPSDGVRRFNIRPLGQRDNERSHNSQYMEQIWWY